MFFFIKGSFFLCFDVLFWILFCGIFFFLIIRVLIGLYQRFGSILTISSYTPYVVLVIHVRWINSGLSFFFFLSQFQDRIQQLQYYSLHFLFCVLVEGYLCRVILYSVVPWPENITHRQINIHHV